TLFLYRAEDGIRAKHWSAEVCSSDLAPSHWDAAKCDERRGVADPALDATCAGSGISRCAASQCDGAGGVSLFCSGLELSASLSEIGRASCRERGWGWVVDV